MEVFRYKLYDIYIDRRRPLSNSMLSIVTRLRSLGTWNKH